MKIAMSLKTKMAVAVSALIAGVISVVGFIVISAGYEKGLHDRETLIRKADKALSLAKENGRNRVEVASA